MAEEVRKHVHNVTTVLNNSTATAFQLVESKKFRCVYCSETSEQPIHIKAHVFEKHDKVMTKDAFINKKNKKSPMAVNIDITGLTCRICSQGMSSLEELAEHLNHIHDKKIYKDINWYMIQYRFDSEDKVCAMCPNIFPNWKVLSDHMNSHYRNFQCTHCDASYVTEERLKVHLTNQKVGSYKCETCGKEFDKYWKKAEHKRRMHSQYTHKQFRCPHCSTRFDGVKELRTHVETEHGKELMKNHKCMLCEKSFVTSTLLNRHHRKDHLKERKYKCNECEATFFLKDHLDRHLILHTGLKPFQCEVCFRTFVRKANLEEHMRIHTGNRRDLTYKCLACDKAFARQCWLTFHQRKDHLMERNVKCSECDKMFYAKRELDLHMVKHTKLKEFQCDLCSKCFPRKQSLEKHVRIHLNAKPFSCNRCAKTFNERSHLKKHVISKHGESVDGVSPMIIKEN